MDKKVKKKEEQPSFFNELGCFMKPYKVKYAFSVILSVLSVASGILAYFFVGKIVSLLFMKTATWQNVVVFASLSILSKILNTVLLNFSTYISHKAAYFTLRDIRFAVTDKMLKLPSGYFEEKGSGRLKTLMVDRIESMEKTLAHMLPELTANLICPLALFIWMFFIDWRLAFIALGWIILGFMLTSGMMKGYEEKYNGQIKAFKGMNQAVVEFVNGIEVIKNFGRTDSCYKKYEEGVYNHASYNVNWQKETLKYSSLGMAVAPFSIFPILISGLLFYANGTIDVASVFMIALLSLGVFGPIMNASTYFDQLAGMGTDAKEIKEVLDYKELERGEEKPCKNCDITYKNVCFSYKNSNKQALKEISFHVPQKTMFALVGPSGSGKSTIAKLLAGFYDADSGEIIIGGKNIKEYSQESLNKMIAYVDQETFLFDMSIEDNIKIGRPDATKEEVIECAKKTGCHQFISKLPEGYNTMAGVAGKSLSGGEKQRIAIARAMMKDCPLIVFDEATASTDPENQVAIQKAIKKATEGKTLIVVAHRLSTIKNADQIAFIEDGKIKAIGKHEDLLKNCREYANMWKLSEDIKND